MKVSNFSRSCIICCLFFFITTNSFSASSFIGVGCSGTLNQQTGKYNSNPMTYHSVDGGVTWETYLLEQTDQIKQLNSVSCSGKNNQHCTALGYYLGTHFSTNNVMYKSADGGINWVSHELSTLKNDTVYSGTCSGDKNQYCIATGRSSGKAAIFVSPDSGIHWTKRILGRDGDISYLAYISCAGTNSKYCVAFGHYRERVIPGKPRANVKSIGFRTDDGGLTWKEMYIPHFDGDTQVLAVSCNGTHGEYCNAVGHFNNTPIVYTTLNGGINWTPNIFASDEAWNTQLATVSCIGSSGQYCVAIGNSRYTYSQGSAYNDTKAISYISTDSGFTWSPYAINQSSSNWSNLIKSVNCFGETGTYCLAIGDHGENVYNPKIGSTEVVSSPITLSSDDGGINWSLYHNNFKNAQSGMVIHSIATNGTMP